MRWARLKFLRGSRQQRSRIREWLENRPGVARVLRRGGGLHVTEYSLARGVALGLFIGLTPTVGLQFILLVIACIIFRANFPASLIISLVSNPFTMAPLYFGYNRIGQYLLPLIPFAAQPADEIGVEIARETLALILGSLVVAIPCTVMGYFGFLWAWRMLRLKLPYTARLDIDEQPPSS